MICCFKTKDEKFMLIANCYLKTVLSHGGGGGVGVTKTIQSVMLGMSLGVTEYFWWEESQNNGQYESL